VTEVPHVTTADPAPDPAARGRRSFRAALVRLAAGAALLLLASGRTWSTTVAGGGDLPTVTVDLTGSDLIAGGAVALLVLAGIAGLLATRRFGRVVVGVLLVLAGLAVVFFAGRFGATWSSSLGDGDTIQGLVFDRVGTVAPLSTTVTAWWIAAVLAGVLVTAGGFLAIVTSGSWPQMGRRYERREGADAPERDARPRSAWEQLDEGIDPTDEPPHAVADDTTADPTLGAGGEA
jgi:uncharacterized membrane protein (TIGR02234 family)